MPSVTSELLMVLQPEDVIAIPLVFTEASRASGNKNCKLKNRHKTIIAHTLKDAKKENTKAKEAINVSSIQLSQKC